MSYAKYLEGRRLLASFPAGKDFAAVYAAEKWCRENGYVCGSHQRDAPRGLMPEYQCYGVAKWRDLTEEERWSCVGLIYFPTGESRSGPAEIWISEGWPPC